MQSALNQVIVRKLSPAIDWQNNYATENLVLTIFGWGLGSLLSRFVSSHNFLTLLRWVGNLEGSYIRKFRVLL